MGACIFCEKRCKNSEILFLCRMKAQNPFEHLNCTFTINESKRAKRISLKIKPPNSVILTLPHRSSVKKALRFASEHQQWVEQKLLKAQAKAATQQTIITSESDFSTKFHTLKFMPHDRVDGFVRIYAKEARIYYSKLWNETDTQVQDLVQIALRETYRKEAKDYLPTRLEELAKQVGFTYNKVSIRDSKGRWGSCSGKKNISLSLSLMKLPYHLIDYILLHELCHTVEMNHGERFHALLDKVCSGRSKVLNKEVKKYSIS